MFRRERVVARYGELVPVVVTNAGYRYEMTPRQADMLAYVRDHAEATFREVAAAVGLDASTVHRDGRLFTRLGLARATTEGRGRAARTTWRVAKDVVIRAVKVSLGELIARALERNVASTATREVNQEVNPRVVDATFDGGTAWRAVGERLRARRMT